MSVKSQKLVGIIQKEGHAIYGTEFAAKYSCVWRQPYVAAEISGENGGPGIDKLT